MLWAFSIWLESVAILPQLFMLQRTGEAETITTHYIFALGAYRALYIPNWIYRYFTDGYFDPIAVVAGLVQTILYSDFFYIYYTKYAHDDIHDHKALTYSQSTTRTAIQPASLGARREKALSAKRKDQTIWFVRLSSRARNHRQYVCSCRKDAPYMLKPEYLATCLGWMSFRTMESQDESSVEARKRRTAGRVTRRMYAITNKMPLYTSMEAIELFSRI
jgi:hypothetical protein